MTEEEKNIDSTEELEVEDKFAAESTEDDIESEVVEDNNDTDKIQEDRPKRKRKSSSGAKKKSSLVSSESIKLDLAVELGRLRMTAKRLMELSPGDLLDIDVLPENGVNLVVKGKCVGKAELMKIGEKIGIRIIELN